MSEKEKSVFLDVGSIGAVEPPEQQHDWVPFSTNALVRVRKRRYYCSRCKREGTERDIQMKISKRCYAPPRLKVSADGW